MSHNSTRNLTRDTTGRGKRQNKSDSSRTRREEYRNSPPSQPRPTSPGLKYFSQISCDLSSSGKYYYVEGKVGYIDVEGVIDTGANQCFISSRLIGKAGLALVRGTAQQVTLADGNLVESEGYVKFDWKSKDSSAAWVTHKAFKMASSEHDLVLGNDFIRQNNLLKKVKKPRKYTDRISLEPQSGGCGDLRQALYVNFMQLDWKRMEIKVHISHKEKWHRVNALADTGSDAMLISAEFAQEIGAEVGESNKFLILANGTRSKNLRRIEEVILTFRESPKELKFAPNAVSTSSVSASNMMFKTPLYVLDNLPVKMILSSQLLMEYKVFEDEKLSIYESLGPDVHNLGCRDSTRRGSTRNPALQKKKFAFEGTEYDEEDSKQIPDSIYRSLISNFE